MLINKILSGLSWQSGSVLIQAVSQILVMAILARHLSADEFGLVAAANIIIVLLQMMSEAGVGAAIIQKKKITEGFIQTAIIAAFFLGVFFSVGAYCVAQLVEDFFNMPGLKEIVQVLSISFIFFGPHKIPEGLLQKEFNFKVLLKINFISNIFGYAIPSVVLAYFGYGVWVLVYATLAQVILKTFLLFLAHPVRLFISVKTDDFKELLHFGMGITLIKYWNYVIRQGDRFVVGKQLSSNSLGEYHLASQLAMMPGQYLGDILDGVFFPVMSKVQSDFLKLKIIYFIVIGFSMSVMATMGVFLAANSSVIINIIYGDKWSGLATVFSILSLGAVFRAGSRISDVLNRSLGLVYQAANRKFLVALSILLFTYLGVRYQLIGVGLGVLFCNVIAFYLMTHLSVRKLNIKYLTFLWSLRLVFVYVLLNLAMNFVLWVYSGVLFNEPYAELLLNASLNAMMAYVFFNIVVRLHLNDIEQYIPPSLLNTIKNVTIFR